MRRFLTATLIGLLWTALFGLSLFAQSSPEEMPSSPSFTIPPFEPPAGATITVTTGVDNLADNGDCTLREAIQSANTDAAVDACPAGDGTDLILLPAGSYGLSLEGRSEDENATGDLDIRSSLVISGAGSETTIIDANRIDRVLHVFSETAVSIWGVTIQNGKTADASTSGCGSDGGDSCDGEPGGGIYNSGTLTLTNSTLTSNQTGGTRQNMDFIARNGGDGGGIFNTGILAGNDITVSGNTTGDGGDFGLEGHGGNGGGIANVGGTTILNASIITGNKTGNGYFIQYTGSVLGGDGGGVYSTGQLVLSETSILENVTGERGRGGGVFNGGILSLAMTVVASNVAEGRQQSAGGVFNEAQATIVESSVRNNKAYSGGGIANHGALQLMGSLIDSNETFDGDGSYGRDIYDGGPGAGIANTGVLTVETSTVTGNRTGNGIVVDWPRGRKGSNGGDGGGIFNRGTAIVRDTDIISNATGRGGDNYATDGGNGGGIANVEGQLLIRTSMVVGNSTGIGGHSNPYDYGAAGNGGGIYTTGALSITNSEIVKNVTFFKGDGGGVYSTGILSITASTIAENSAGSDGGGIYTTDVLSITESIIAANSAGGFDGDGGGIYTSGNGTIVHSAIRRNASGNNGSGGGVANAGALVLVNSLIDNNKTRNAQAGSKSGSIDAGPGGGIANSGLVILKNSTISANRTGNGDFSKWVIGLWGSGGKGGGIHNLGTVWLENTTIADNLTGAQGPCDEMSCEGPNAAGGGIANEEGAVILRNTILSNSSATGEGPDCWGSLSSAGYNLIESTRNCTLNGYMTGNILNRYAWLELLADNGGHTPTHALRPQSPALNAGSCSDSDSAPVVTDQRGESRPQGDGCDIGAFESGLSFIPPETLHLPLIRKQSN